jgi:PPK2 family polyphosphate:nucleotide phosphotransferase
LAKSAKKDREKDARKNGKAGEAVKAANTQEYPDYRVLPGERIMLAAIDADQSEGYKKKKDVLGELEEQRLRIQDLQSKLYAENKKGLLIVLQAMDTGGKDGAIKHVFSGVNPQGCRVSSFKAPNPEEANHDFLWRYHKSAPAVGRIGIFNRSHYEDVLVVRVKDLVPEGVWRPRYALINNFEANLTQNNISVIKFYLHISKDEQKRRLESRLADPDKRWKFSTNDIKERAYWEDYQRAFEDAISETSTDFAPWYVIPANKKWYRNLVIARAIADTLEAMDPNFPPAEVGLDKISIPD